jgi:hypothetical protein
MEANQLEQKRDHIGQNRLLNEEPEQSAGNYDDTLEDGTNGRNSNIKTIKSQ